MVKNYTEFIVLESSKEDRLAIQEKIMKLFKDKPEMEASSDNWPTSKNIYGMPNIKEYVGGDNLKIDGAFHDLMKTDKKIKSVSVKNKYYGQSYPYYYHVDHTTEDEVKKAKLDMESSQKEPEKKKAKVLTKTRKVAGEAPKKPRAPKK